MRHSDILAAYKGTPTHPFIASFVVERTELAQFQSSNEDQPDVQILGIDRCGRDHWTIFAACASRSHRDILQGVW